MKTLDMHTPLRTTEDIVHLAPVAISKVQEAILGEGNKYWTTAE